MSHSGDPEFDAGRARQMHGLERHAAALAQAAAHLGSSQALLANRPGSWEAAHLRALLAGTVGEADDALAVFGHHPDPEETSR